jgi:hypothetical protein
MMARTIIRVLGSDDAGAGVCILESPKVENAGKIYRLTSNPADEPFAGLCKNPVQPGLVREAGTKLLQDLLCQPAMPQALAKAFGNPGDLSPIYIFLQDAPTAELLPWESLHDPHPDRGFLSLTRNWQIVRMRQALEGDQSDVCFRPPLRMLALLSAAGDSAATSVSALPEWNALWDALVKSRSANSVPVSLRVLVGEESLLQHIESVPAINGVQVKVEMVAGKDQLLSTIRTFAPFVLHFFCHGVSSGMSHLQIGTRSDWTAERSGSVTITAKDLRDRADPTYKTWLVTLNCCESASQSRDVRNLASSLITYGFPAAVGMREVIDSQHAHLLSNRLYRGLFEQISALPENSTCVVEWASTLFEARQDLSTHAFQQPPIPASQLAACDYKEWTVPVLYTRTEPFRIMRVPVLTPTEMMVLMEEITTLQAQIAKTETMNLPQEIKQAFAQASHNRIAELEGKLNGSVR